MSAAATDSREAVEGRSTPFLSSIFSSVSLAKAGRNLNTCKKKYLNYTVADPDPNPDPYVYGPPGSGSISHRYGSGFFYHQAKIVRKTLIPTVCTSF
jgi:hypothetical protein